MYYILHMYVGTLNIKRLIPSTVVLVEHDTSNIFSHFECWPIAIKIESSRSFIEDHKLL